MPQDGLLASPDAISVGTPYSDAFLVTLAIDAGNGSQAAIDLLGAIKRQGAMQAATGAPGLAEQVQRAEQLASQDALVPVDLRQARESGETGAPIALAPRQTPANPDVSPEALLAGGQELLTGLGDQAFGAASSVASSVGDAISSIPGVDALSAGVESRAQENPNAVLDFAGKVQNFFTEGIPLGIDPFLEEGSILDTLFVTGPQAVAQDFATSFGLGAGSDPFGVETSSPAAGSSLGLAERVLALQALGASGTDATKASGEVTLGPLPELAPPPTAPVPPPPDFGPVRERLAAAEPKQDLVTGTLAGLAQGGIAGLQSGRNFGEALLAAGLGGIAGLAEGQSDYERALQSYNLAIAEAETGLIDAQRQHAFQQAQIRYQNSLQQWQFDTEQAKLRAPRFIGFQNGVMLFEETDTATGNRVLRWDAQPGAAIRAARAGTASSALEGNTIPLVPEGLHVTPGDPLGSFKVITANLFNTGQLPALLGELWEDQYITQAEGVVNQQFGGAAAGAFTGEPESQGLAVLNTALSMLAADLYTDAANEGGGEFFENAVNLLDPSILLGITGGISDGSGSTAGSGALSFGPPPTTVPFN